MELRLAAERHSGIRERLPFNGPGAAPRQQFGTAVSAGRLVRPMSVGSNSKETLAMSWTGLLVDAVLGGRM